MRPEGLINGVRWSKAAQPTPLQTAVIPNERSKESFRKLCLANESHIEATFGRRLQAKPDAPNQSLPNLHHATVAHAVRCVVVILLADHAPVVIEEVAHLEVILGRSEGANRKRDSLRQEPRLKQEFIRCESMGASARLLEF